MSLVKGVIDGLVNNGKVKHEFKMDGIEFVMEPISTELQVLSDGMVNFNVLKEKYNTKSDFSTYPDMIQKFRSVTQVAFAIVSVDGKPPVDPDADFQEKFSQYKEFRDELFGMPTGMIDYFIEQYNKLKKEEREFFKNFEEEAGKS